MAGFFDGPKPLAIAHRGGDGAGWGKRNTMAAFKSAYELGYRCFETDVVLTKDGRVIIAHGAKNALTARLRGTFSYSKLQSMTYAEISHRLRVDGEHVPLLEELLDKFADVKFFIDPKTNQTVEPLCNLLRSRAELSQVAINSFFHRRVLRAHQLLGKKPTFGIIVWRWPLVGHVRLIRSVRHEHLDFVSCHHWLLKRAIISYIHRNSLRAIIWTVNSEVVIKRAADDGADGIISDGVKLLKQVLRR